MKNTLNSTWWRTLEDLLFCILLESWKLPWIVTNCHDSSRTSLALFFTHSISRRLGFDSVSKFEGDEVDEEGRWGGCTCDEEHESNEGDENNEGHEGNEKVIPSDSATGIAWAVDGAQVTLLERRFCRSVGPAQSCTVKHLGSSPEKAKNVHRLGTPPWEVVKIMYTCPWYRKVVFNFDAKIARSSFTVRQGNSA